MLDVSLADLQQLLQGVIVHPGTTDEAVESAEVTTLIPEGRIEDVVLPSKALTPVERLGIYHGMYLLRMEEALATDYPGLKHFLGDAAFFDLVRGYVQAHPSRHTSLNRLGDHLPEYVKSARLPRAAFCHDLARLELAVTEVFDAPETEVLSEDTIAAMPEDAWERVRLEPIAAFRTVALGYPAARYLDAVKASTRRRPRVHKEDTWVVVFRRDYSVYRQELSRPAYELLTDLAIGRTVGEAVHRALSRRGRRLTEEQLFGFFREWVAGGFFREIAYP